MTSPLDALVRKYRGRGVIVDTNLLLLLIVGAVDPALIPKNKRTRTYRDTDHSILIGFLSRFSRHVTTPNILTEASNLITDGLEAKFADLARTALEEHYVRSVEVVGHAHFARFGLTDVGIAVLAGDQYLVLTDDLRLAHYLSGVGIDVVNFNHLRPLGFQ